MSEEMFPKVLSQAEFGVLAQDLTKRDYTPKEITKDVFMLRNEEGWAYYRRPAPEGVWKRIQYGKNG